MIILHTLRSAVGLSIFCASPRLGKVVGLPVVLQEACRSVLLLNHICDKALLHIRDSYSCG